MNEEISRICKICLAVNLKIFGIQTKQLKALYKNIICAQFDFDFVLEVGVEIGACYICYTQLLKIHKFSELAQTSGKRLQYLKDVGAKISKRSIGFYNERSQHNLSITVIPPISLQSTPKITEGTVLSHPVKNEYIEHEHNTDDDFQNSNNYFMKHPTPTMSATISRTQRPMQIETFFGTKTIQENYTLNKPIDEYFISNPVNVNKEYDELDHSTAADDCQKSNNYMIELPTLTMPLATISLTHRPMQTETLVGSKTIQEKYALNKPINEHFMSDPRNVTEEYVDNKQNTTGDCLKRNNYVIEHPKLTVQPSIKSLLKSSMRTETFTGTEIIQKYTLRKQITEDHDVVSVEKYNEHNIDDDCEKSKASMNNHTLTMLSAKENINLSANRSLPLSSKQTKPIIGTKRKGSDLSNLLEQKREKTDASESRFKNDMAITNTPFTKNIRKLAAANKIDQKKTKIEELIQKLIEIHKQAMITKNKNGSVQNQPTWCDRSQLLLIQLIKLAGSEWAGSMLLAGRVFPLFPQGYLREPSLSELLRMAGFKTNTEPSELYLKQRKDHKGVKSKKSTSLKSVSKKPSNELIKTILSPASLDNQGPSITVKTSLPLSQLSKFSPSNDLDMEFKRDNNPNEFMQNNAIFFRTHQNASKSLQGAVSSLVPKKTSNLIESQEQNVVKMKNHERISSKPNNEEQQKSTESPKQTCRDEMKTIAVPRETNSVIKAMLNKFSKFKEKLDSQNRDYNNDSSSDIEIIENN